MPIPKRRRRGLTLIEVVVTVTIVALMMAAVGVYALGIFTENKRKIALQDVQTTMNALELFKSMRGRYPSAERGLHEAVDAHALKRSPRDPWGTPLTYALVDGEPVVASLGADAAPGGEGENADISSRELEAP